MTKQPDAPREPAAAKGKPTENARAKALAEALVKMDKNFGKGTVIRLGDQPAVPIVGVSTGALTLDLALGVGGLPRGRVIEIYGPEGAGKTTLALRVIAEIQRLGGVAAFIDVEHALDPAWATKVGVNTDDLLVSQPDNGEQALEVVDTLVSSGGVDIVVVDSVAALVSKNELEGDMGQAHVGLQARLMSQALRKLTPSVSRSNTMVIFLNQLREKVGIMFGNPETQPGGRALKFYASIRIDVRKLETLKKDTTPIGIKVRAKVVKNKVAPPFTAADFDIMSDVGISTAGCIVDMAIERNLVEKSGAWYTYGQTRANGRDALVATVRDNDELATEMRAKVLQYEAERLAARAHKPKTV
jgi:recombination protein RecA